MVTRLHQHCWLCRLVEQVQNCSSSPQIHLNPQSNLVQEWWGINDDIKEKAMMLHAKGGCRVFIPDIYKGKSTVEVAEAKHVSPAPQVCCNRRTKWFFDTCVYCTFIGALSAVVLLLPMASPLLTQASCNVEQELQGFMCADV